MDPVIAQQQVQTIKDGLVKADDVNKNSYEKNAASYIEKLKKLDKDFEYVSTITPKDNTNDTVIASGVAYDRNNSQYIVEDWSQNRFLIYDKAWTYVDTIYIPAEIDTNAKQGIDTDGYYLYKTRTTTGGATAPRIQVFTLQGEYRGEISINQLHGEEIEGIAYDWRANVFFINTNAKDEIKTSIYLILQNELLDCTT